MTKDSMEADQAPPEEETRPKSSRQAERRLRSEVLANIQRFEERLFSASFSSEDEDAEDSEDPESNVRPVPEFLEEQKDAYRTELYESLRHLFLDEQNAKGTLSIDTYEQAVYDHIDDRIRRMLAFYHAINRGMEEIRRISAELSDPSAMEIKPNEVGDLLNSLTEVYFVRNLGHSLGVFAPDLDKIVDYVIARNFAPVRPRVPRSEQ